MRKQTGIYGRFQRRVRYCVLPCSKKGCATVAAPTVSEGKSTAASILSQANYVDCSMALAVSARDGSRQ